MIGHGTEEHSASAEERVVAGRGKLEGIQFSADPQLVQAVTTMLATIGEDPQREGLRRTPERVAVMYAELTAGYTIDTNALINDARYQAEGHDLVVVRDIDFASLCEHHLLPFLGRVHVAYLPGQQIIGLSKIPRIVEMYARRLQVQERMTAQIADLIMDAIQPQGVAVMAEGSHLCAVMRGVRSANASMVTTTLRGVFRTDPTLRAEVLAQLRAAK